MNKTLELLQVAVGILVQCVLVVPIIMFIWRLFIRPLLHPHPVKKYLSEDAYALIVGASVGTGKEYARQFAAEGFNLILIARRELTELKDEIEKKYNVKVIVLNLDIGTDDPEEWKKLQTLLEQNNVTVCVNNAGVTVNAKFTFGELEYSSINKLMNINIKGLTRTTNMFLRYAPKDKPILAVFMSSCTSNLVAPYNAPYSSSKAYLYQLGRSIYYEYDNLDVTIFKPWFISTDMIHNRKLSLGVISAETFVNAAMKQMGMEICIDPYWAHYCQDCMMALLPDSYTAANFKKEIRSVKKPVKVN